MPSAISLSPKQRTALRALLFAVMISAGSMALALWWVGESTVVTNMMAAEEATSQELMTLSLAQLPASAVEAEVITLNKPSEAKPVEVKPAELAPAEPNPAEPKPAKKKHKKSAPTVKVDCKKTKCIALTFDDGPGPHTAKLLKKLKKAQAPATFFVIGKKIDDYPDVVRSMAKQGHEVASHTWSHQDMRRMNPKKLNKELTATSKAIKELTGQAPKLVRPPFGSINTEVQNVLKSRGESAVLWNIDPVDWQHKNSKRTVNAATTTATSGSIILLHDVQPSTVEAVPQIVKELRKQGYTLVTVSELLGDVKAGKTYRRR